MHIEPRFGNASHRFTFQSCFIIFFHFLVLLCHLNDIWPPNTDKMQKIPYILLHGCIIQYDTFRPFFIIQSHTWTVSYYCTTIYLNISHSLWALVGGVAFYLNSYSSQWPNLIFRYIIKTQQLHTVLQAFFLLSAEDISG